MSESPWWEPPLAGTDSEHLLAALDRQRATFRWKADGRGRAGLTATVGASTMTLAGLLKHLTLVEDQYAGMLDGGPQQWGEDADLEWVTALEDDPQQLYDGYDAAVARARERWAAADPDQLLTRGTVAFSARRILFDLLEEYGRHTGHADLLSEAVDGRVGEDPPSDWTPVGAVEDGEQHEPPVPVFEMRRMVGARFEMVDLSGADLHHVDLDGARFRGVNLSRVHMSSSDLIDVRIDAGDLENVVINDVEVSALVDAELDRRDPDRALMRPTDADGFRHGWQLIESRWAETLDHARRLDPALWHESVDGEWSLVQTLRHLVFAEQAWVARGVLGHPAPWHPLALPWDDAPPMPGVTHERDLRADVEEVLGLRAETQAMVRGVLDALTDDVLDEERAAPDEDSWPRGTHTVRQCLLTTLNEEYHHRRFAERDLAALEQRS